MSAVPAPENVAAIAKRMTADQRRLISKRGRYFSTSLALSLPMCGVVERTGPYNQWQRTALGQAIRTHILEEEAS